MPNVNIDELKNLISNGEISAITLDTSIFIHHHYGFEVGILSKLSQFNNTDIKFIVVDMIQHEILSHLIDEAKKDKAETKNILKSIGNSWGVTPTIRQELMDTLFTNNEVEKSQIRFNDFKVATGALEIKCEDLSSIGKVIELYFNKMAPFSTKSDKKNEFPDAFVLSALEAWAESNNTKILAVSKDNDWKGFCSYSSVVYCIEDLSQSLTAFHSNISVSIINSLRSIDITELNNDIMQIIPQQLDNITINIDASSSFYYEPEYSEITIDNSEQIPISDIDNFLSEIKIIEAEDNEFSVQLTINCEVDIETNVNFNTWDGIDKEYVSMGGGEFNTTKSIDIDIIINFIKDDDNVVEVNSIEVINSNVTIDLGDIEPDWLSSPDDYE